MASFIMCLFYFFFFFLSTKLTPYNHAEDTEYPE